MKKVNLLLIVGALISMDAMAFTAGSYECSGTDKKGAAVEADFNAGPYMDQSCYDSSTGATYCDMVKRLEGAITLRLADDTILQPGWSFSGDLNNPTSIYYSNGRVLARRRVDIGLHQNQTDPSIVRFVLIHPYHGRVEGTLNCTKR